MSKIKTHSEIELLRIGGKRLATVLRKTALQVAPGVTTGELNHYVETLISEYGDSAPFKGYTPYGADYPFPAAICISVNDEIVHGIPGERVLKEGDIVGLDCGLAHNGMIVDSAVSVAVGTVSEEVNVLMQKTQEALMLGIKAARGGNRIGDISAAIESVALAMNYGNIRELGGHGVGHKVHEEPYVPNWGKKGTGPILKPGMVLALEPMFTLGGGDIIQLPDGYTIATKDGSYAAHVEHTILITDGAAEILTLE